MTEPTASMFEELFLRAPLGMHVYAVRDAGDGSSLERVAANPAAAELLGGEDATLDRDPSLAQRLAEVAHGAPAAEHVTSWNGRALACRLIPLSGSRVAVSLAPADRIDKAQFLEAVLEHLPLPVFVKDARDLRYVEMNRACLEFVGVSRERLIGKTDLTADFLPPEIGQVLTATDRKILAEKRIVDVPDEPVPNAAGELRLLRSLKVPLLDERGDPQFLLGISVDVTELKRAEEARRTSESELRQIQERLRETVLDLMTPALPIHEGVLVVPLVGYMDTQRSVQFMAALLESVVLHRAEVVIVDITGVPVVDSAVAGHILRATRAIGLLGAECIVTGLSPQIAQTLVQLGTDLWSVRTLSDLRAGVAYAMTRKPRRS